MSGDLPKSGDNSDSIIEVHAETAKHETRDSHGRFLRKGDNSTIPNFPASPAGGPNTPSVNLLTQKI